MKIKKICISIIAILYIACVSNRVLAATDLNQIYNGSADPAIMDASGKILGAVQVIGYSTAVIMLTYIGIKFLWESPDGKAKIKEQLVPYIIGVIILFAGSTFAVWIGQSARNATTGGQSVKDSIKRDAITGVQTVEDAIQDK